MPKKPETLEECQDAIRRFLALLLEARDALPAIGLASARLHGVSLNLAGRIEEAMEPWRVE